MTEDKNLNAWKRGTQEVDEIFARFESVDGRRRGLVASIRENPTDQTLWDNLRALSGIPQLQRAAQQGIFISYARHDEIFALDVSMILIDAGLPVWLDVIHGANEDWSEEVDQALDRCGLMVAVVSSLAFSDEDAIAERRAFVDNGKLVLPVFREPCSIDSDLLWLDPIDFSQGNDQGINQIHELLVQSPAQA